MSCEMLLQWKIFAAGIFLGYMTHVCESSGLYKGLNKWLTRIQHQIIILTHEYMLSIRHHRIIFTYNSLVLFNVHWNVI